MTVVLAAITVAAIFASGVIGGARSGHRGHPPRRTQSHADPACTRPRHLRRPWAQRRLCPYRGRRRGKPPLAGTPA